MTDDISKVEDRHIAAAFREVIGPDGGRIKNDEICDFIVQRSRELAALESAHPSRGVVDGNDAEETALYVEHCANKLRAHGSRIAGNALAGVATYIRTLARQLAEAKAEADQWERDYNALSVRMLQLTGHAEQAESQLAEATRRLAEVEADMRLYADDSIDASRLGRLAQHWANQLEAALQKTVDSPTKSRYNCPTEAHDGEE